MKGQPAVERGPTSLGLSTYARCDRACPEAAGQQARAVREIAPIRRSVASTFDYASLLLLARSGSLEENAPRRPSGSQLSPALGGATVGNAPWTLPWPIGYSGVLSCGQIHHASRSWIAGRAGCGWLGHGGRDCPHATPLWAKPSCRRAAINTSSSGPVSERGTQLPPP